MGKSLDNKTAYVAMYEFLVGYYERTKSDDVGALLGGMSLLADGDTADPAMWSDWLECVSNAKHGKADISLKLSDT